MFDIKQEHEIDTSTIDGIMKKARKMFEKEGLSSSQKKNIFFFLYENDDNYSLKCLIKYRWSDGCSLDSSRYADRQRDKVKNVAFEIYKMLSETDLDWCEISREDLSCGKEFKIMKNSFKEIL